MSDDVKSNISQSSTWKRGLYILLFSLFYSVAELVLFAVVMFQFLLKLFTGTTNTRLLKLSQGLGTYIYQIIQYITFNADYQPYPFGAWPKGEPKPSRSSADDSSDIGHIDQRANNDGD